MSSSHRDDDDDPNFASSGAKGRQKSRNSSASPRFRRPFSARSARCRSTVSIGFLTKAHIAMERRRRRRKTRRKRTPRVALVLSLQLPARTRHAHETTTPGRVESRTRRIRDVSLLVFLCFKTPERRLRGTRRRRHLWSRVWSLFLRATTHTRRETTSSVFFVFFVSALT